MRGKAVQLRGLADEYPGNGPGNSATEPKPTRWWLRLVSSAARVGEQRAVTWKRLYVRPSCWTRVRLGVLIGPPNVSGWPNPASSIRTISTLGASSGAFGPGTIDQSATDWSMVRPIVPPKLRSGIGRTVRSGLNLWAASARASWSSLRLSLSIWATD